MRYISPSLLREYLFCPRAFYYKRFLQCNLVSSTNANTFAQERIDTFTSGFFSTLSMWNEEISPNSQFDLEYLLSSKFFTHLEFHSKENNQPFRELDEKVFTLLLWLTIRLWEENASNDYQRSYHLPLMVNEFIQAPEIYLQGRPSAVFRQPNDSALILIQTFQQKFPHIKRGELFQAALYARILQTMGIDVEAYLYVNYYQMDLKFEQLKHSDFITLDKFLDDFRIAIHERSFVDPPKNPPCENCELKLICLD